MYEDPPRRSPFLRCAPVRWLRHFWPFCVACWLCLTLFACCGTLAGFLAGCNAPAAMPAARDANLSASLAAASPGSLAFGFADAAARAGDGADWLYAIGCLAILAGGICLGHPQGPSGIGWGCLIAGACLLLAGAVLPLMAGWVGLVLLGLLLAGFVLKKTDLGSRLISPLSNLFKAHA